MAVIRSIEPMVEQLGPIQVRRVLPAPEQQMVGPFIFLDQGGPLEVPAHIMQGVGEHPHAGLSTLTYLLAGNGMHRDSAGHAAAIGAGDVALMTAGSGITHEERPNPEDSSPMRMVYFAQFWLALPDDVEDIAPTFEHHARDDLPLVALAGGEVRLLMGDGWGTTAPTTQYAEAVLADITVKAGGSLPLDVSSGERALFLLEGDAAVGETSLKRHHLALLEEQSNPVISSTGGARLLIFGGAPFPSRRYIAGSFVASSPEKINRWAQAYQAGKFPSMRGV
ncbi:MAG: pirin family protein [Pseudomonadota bacterium]